MTVVATQPRPIFVAGQWQTSDDVLEVPNPARPDEPAGLTYLATADQLEQATAAAVEIFAQTRAAPAYERGALLRRISAGVLERRDDLARLLALEIGKPIRDAVIEAERTALAFRIAAEEAERMHGELIPLDLNAASRGRVGLTRRFTIGPVAAISPFNLPLGLAVHKLAPALAVGAPIVLKAPSRAPLALLALAEIIEGAGAPPGAVSIMPMSRAVGDTMIGDDRFGLLTFTGSPAVGWDMKARAGKKKVVLELGGNASAIVDASADLNWAVTRCLTGAFKFAGQLCVSIQRLLLHEQIADEFLERFIERAGRLRMGDPLDASTELGPIIDTSAVERTQRWIEEALASGGRLLMGGDARGQFFSPTVLADVPPDAQICTEEAFAPVAIVGRFSNFDEALALSNGSRFGLQAGVFTSDLTNAWRAFNELEVGGVIINDIPGYRIDHMPFGGVKESGLGREGIRWAMEDMTELRLMVLAPIGG
jgi:glyceraldehyde-3-phosphate dehydrogenase (NADP+)